VEYVADEVFSVTAVTDKAQDEAEDANLIAMEKSAKGALVTSRDLLDQELIRLRAFAAGCDRANALLRASGTRDAHVVPPFKGMRPQ
jgi:hypothetical protein